MSSEVKKAETPVVGEGESSYDVVATPSAQDFVLHEENEPRKPLWKRVLLDPTFQILVGACLGLAIGISISGGKASKEVISWIALPGQLFLRALKCVVLPLVFVNIILSVMDMLAVGKAVSIGWKTIAMYMLTTMLAAIDGLVVVLCFQSLFSKKEQEPVKTNDFMFACGGSKDNKLYLTATDTGVACVANSTEIWQKKQSTFVLTDVGKVFAVKNGGVADDISMSKTIQDGIFRKLVPSNITGDFLKSNFLGVIAFAIAFAFAARIVSQTPAYKKKKLSIVCMCEEFNQIFLSLITGVIFLTPYAVVSLIAGALGDNKDLGKAFSNIGILAAATLVAMVIHICLTIPTLYFIIVKKTPFGYLKHLIPAQTFAFASASSAATLPVTMECVKNSGEVPDTIRNFVLSLGATINMDGGAIYFPTAIVFLAVSTGNEDKLDAAAYFLIVLLSTLGSAGTAPVPSASLVLIITAYNTVFDTTGTPSTFSYILAIDWFMDRCRTLLNVSGDAMMARIITAMSGGGMEGHEDEDVRSHIDSRLSGRMSIFENEEYLNKKNQQV